MNILKASLIFLLLVPMPAYAHVKKQNNDGAIIGFILGAVIGAQLQQQQRKQQAPAAIRPRPRPQFLCNQDRYFPAHKEWRPTFDRNGVRVGSYQKWFPGEYRTITYWCN